MYTSEQIYTNVLMYTTIQIYTNDDDVNDTQYQ